MTSKDINSMNRLKKSLYPYSTAYPPETLLLQIYKTYGNLWDMKKMSWLVIILGVMIGITGYITCRVFGSRFAEITIDYFAFFAGIFLVAEGIYKILVSEDSFFPCHFLRAVRVIIGTCIFTIHLLQFMR